MPSWRIGTPQREVSLRSSGGEPAAEGWRAIPAQTAGIVVRQLLEGAKPLPRAELLALAEACGLVRAGALAVGSFGARDVAQVVAEALARRRIVAYVRERRRVVRTVEDTPDVLGPEAEPASWIEIELRDDDGDPIASEPYRVDDPHGRTWRGTTDGNGRARIDGIDPGSCKVMFPRLPATWAKA